MKRRTISMRKIRVVLDMKWSLKKSHAIIAKSVGISSSTVSEYVTRALAANLGWPPSEEIDDEALDKLLYPEKTAVSEIERGSIDCEKIHKELKRKGVTLNLLWIEYHQEYPKGFAYSYFCEKYNKYRNRLDVWMRHPYIAGEKMLVDYSGMTMSIISDTGEIIEVQIFVMVLGASNLAYVEATFTQSLPDWIASHRRAFEYFGGVGELLIPDNLKSGITKGHRYDPDLNPTYHEFARHYGVAILPARVRKPQDKAKAEQTVGQVERSILAPLRNQKYFSLNELNQDIWELLEPLNNKPFQKLPGSRRSMFNDIEKEALSPLPSVPYEFAEWKSMQADGGYHIEVGFHYYSVPFKYAKKKIDIRYTQRQVQCFYRSQPIALHRRSFKQGKYTTVAEHMPPHHQLYAEWTPERTKKEASTIGQSTLALVEKLYEVRDHPHIAARVSLGIVRLAKQYTKERLERACQRALVFNLFTYQSVEAILKNRMDEQALPNNNEVSTNPVTELTHENIRDEAYYQ